MKKDKSQIRKELITPQKAAKYLERNIGNRPITQSQVDRWVDRIHKGEWFSEVGMICFDTNGVLIDGQHRLSAIVRSGIGVYINVQTDCNPEAKYAMDSGRPRTRQQILKMDGVANSAVISGAVAEIIHYEETGTLGISNVWGTGKARKIEHIEAHRRYFQDPDAWQKAANTINGSYRLLKGKVTPAPLTAIGYLMLKQDAPLAHNFFMQLADELPADDTIRALRKRFNAGIGNNSGQRQFWYLLLAWNAVKTGVPVRSFPKPEALRANKKLDDLLATPYPMGH